MHVRRVVPVIGHDYRNCVFDNLPEMVRTDQLGKSVKTHQKGLLVETVNIRNKNLSNYLTKNEKVALRNSDDKRHWIGIDSLALGHYKLC